MVPWESYALVLIIFVWTLAYLPYINPMAALWLQDNLKRIIREAQQEVDEAEKEKRRRENQITKE